MGVVRFCVVFNKPDKVYYPGEMVTGRVELVLNSIIEIRGVELKIKGKAKCKWTEGRQIGYHRNSEIYIKNEQILIGGRDKFQLPAGEYTYPFSVMLPDKAPASFKGHYGAISYYGRAKIDIPLAFDKKERTIFTVISPLNPNLLPNLLTPSKTEKSKTFCCLWCVNGQCTMVVYLPRTVFYATESTPITLEIDNASNVTINAVHVYLKRSICYHAEGEIQDEDSKLQKLRLGRVEEGQSQTWTENFTIPSISFPNIDGCTFIKIDHELHIEAATSGMHFDLDIHIPVTIGDAVFIKNPDAPIITPQMQTVPQPGMNNASPNPGFVVPSPHQNVGGMPQMPTQKNSAPVQQYPSQTPPTLPVLPPKLVTNPESSQNPPHSPVAAYADTGYCLALPSFNSDVQLENTSFLNDSKGQNAENAPLPPFSPSVPPRAFSQRNQLKLHMKKQETFSQVPT